MAWIGPAIAGGASLLGGMMKNDSSAKQAQIDREWQRENAQNAHQYEVSDLRAAGLNPILSATGGSGARASGGAGIADQTDAISPAVSSAIAARRNSQEMDNMKALEDLSKQQTKTSVEEQYNKLADTELKKFQSAQVHASTSTEMARTATELEKVITEKTLQDYHRAQATSARALAGKTSHETRSSKVTADLDEKMRSAERLIAAGEGASSAFRNLIPGLRLNKPKTSPGKK